MKSRLLSIATSVLMKCHIVLCMAMLSSAVNAQPNALGSLLELYPEEGQTTNKSLELYTANTKKRIGSVQVQPYKVIRQDGRWVRVRFLRPVVPLWVSADFVKISGNIATVLPDTLNVRLAASRSSVVVTTLPKGYSSAVLSTQNNFVKVRTPATTEVAILKEGWSVAAKTIRKPTVAGSTNKAKGKTNTSSVTPKQREVTEVRRELKQQDTKKVTLSTNTSGQTEKEEAKGADEAVPFSKEPTDAKASQHLLSPGDAISVRVFGESDLSAENLRVPVSGAVSFPLIGSVNVGGKTTAQIESEVIAILSQGYVNNPKVAVSIFSYRPIFIRGAVRSPGSFPYTEGLSIAKVLALAGGSKHSAKDNGVNVLRDGETIVSGLTLDSQYIVSSGDVITLQEELGVSEDSQLFIYLHGEVASPGAYIYRRNLTVEKAIVLAGGFTLRGSKKKVKVTRYNGVQENEEPLKLKGVKLYTTIEPGDVIDVGARWF